MVVTISNAGMRYGTWIAFLKGDDVELLDRALQDRHVLMVPGVLTELLSDPNLSSSIADILSDVPMIEIEAGFWQRASRLRAKVLSDHRKARLGGAHRSNLRRSSHFSTDT